MSDMQQKSDLELQIEKTKGYQAELREKAQEQLQRQKQEQERTLAKNEKKKRFGAVPDNGGAWIWGIISMGTLMGMIEETFSGNFYTDGLICAIIAGVTGVKAVLTFVNNKANRRYANYVQRIGMQSFVSIADLENSMGYSHKTVMKDIRNMISKGILKQAHLDDEGKYLLMTNEAYNEYLMARRDVNQMSLMQQAHAMEQDEKVENEELAKVLKEGEQYLEQIRGVNSRIQDESMTTKLVDLEANCQQIFSSVEKHPEKLPEIHKFLDYYMPTTIKLVNSYEEFDKQPVQGENIQKAKREIEETFDMINLAFSNLANRLYESDAMDVTSDISVLKTLLAQEGLDKKDFTL